MKTVSSVLMAIMASVQACGISDGPNEFNYDDIGDNWQVEGFHSPVCASGMEQSPIDLTGGDSDDVLGFVISEHTDYTEEDDKVLEKKTHTLEMGLDSGKLSITFPNGEQDEFNSLQFHAHSPSEHTIDGEFRDLEIHFVHTHPDGDKFAVIGVFFQSGDYDDNEFIAQLLFDEVEGEEAELGAVDVASFLDGLNTDAFWHYDGSFTTPPCTEGVEWFVLKEVQEISVDQLNAFQSYGWGNADYENGEGNNRRTQPLNSRTLYSIGDVAAEGEEEAAGEDGETAGEGSEVTEEEHGDDCECVGCGGNNVDIKIDFNVNAQ